MEQVVNTKARCKRTRFALLWMKLAEEPFVVLYGLLHFILRKDLGATALHLSLFAMLRPVMALFSFYWGANLFQRRDKLLTNLMGAWFLGRCPFLLLPWIDSIWYVIFVAAMYQLFHRAGMPALMEILKVNVAKETREKAYTRYFVMSFLESILLGLTIGTIISGMGWKPLFFIATLISMSSILLQMRIPLNLPKKIEIPEQPSWKERLIKPWQESFALMRRRPDFADFQWSFMIGGVGLMVIAPALPIYFADHLLIEHSTLAYARTILMGIGVALSAQLWRKGLKTIVPQQLCIYILCGFALFPLLLLFAGSSLFWLHTAFLFYGIAQAGSHLLWNLSGTLFAPDEDSSRFTSTNILMVGLRGLVGPLLGGFLCNLFGVQVTLLLGFTITLSGTFFLLRRRALKTA